LVKTGIAPKGECDAGKIKAIRWEAEDILSFILEPCWRRADACL
jgi:hypothetical protein